MLLNNEMVVESIALQLGQIGKKLDVKKLSAEVQRKY